MTEIYGSRARIRHELHNRNRDYASVRTNLNVSGGSNSSGSIFEASMGSNIGSIASAGLGALLAGLFSGGSKASSASSAGGASASGGAGAAGGASASGGAGAAGGAGGGTPAPVNANIQAVQNYVEAKNSYDKMQVDANGLQGDITQLKKDLEEANNKGALIDKNNKDKAAANKMSDGQQERHKNLSESLDVFLKGQSALPKLEADLKAAQTSAEPNNVAQSVADSLNSSPTIIKTNQGNVKVTIDKDGNTTPASFSEADFQEYLSKEKDEQGNRIGSHSQSDIAAKVADANSQIDQLKQKFQSQKTIKQGEADANKKAKENAINAQYEAMNGVTTKAGLRFEITDHSTLAGAISQVQSSLTSLENQECGEDSSVTVGANLAELEKFDKENERLQKLDSKKIQEQIDKKQQDLDDINKKLPDAKKKMDEAKEKADAVAQKLKNVDLTEKNYQNKKADWNNTKDVNGLTGSNRYGLNKIFRTGLSASQQEMLQDKKDAKILQKKAKQDAKAMGLDDATKALMRQYGLLS